MNVLCAYAIGFVVVAVFLGCTEKDGLGESRAYSAEVDIGMSIIAGLLWPLLLAGAVVALSGYWAFCVGRAVHHLYQSAVGK